MHTYCEEVVVIQKKKNKTERKEKEGESDVWVIGSMFDAVKNRACVGIFDGLDISKGEIDTHIDKHEETFSQQKDTQTGG